MRKEPASAPAPDRAPRSRRGRSRSPHRTEARYGPNRAWSPACHTPYAIERASAPNQQERTRGPHTSRRSLPPGGLAAAPAASIARVHEKAGPLQQRVRACSRFARARFETFSRHRTRNGPTPEEPTVETGIEPAAPPPAPPRAPPGAPRESAPEEKDESAVWAGEKSCTARTRTTASRTRRRTLSRSAPVTRAAVSASMASRIVTPTGLPNPSRSLPEKRDRLGRGYVRQDQLPPTTGQRDPSVRENLQEVPSTPFRRPRRSRSASRAPPPCRRPSRDPTGKGRRPS